MCLVTEVLMVCDKCVVICMHLRCVDPGLRFLWMPKVNFKFEKLKGEYALSSKSDELSFTCPRHVLDMSLDVSDVLNFAQSLVFCGHEDI